MSSFRKYYTGDTPRCREETCPDEDWQLVLPPSQDSQLCRVSTVIRLEEQTYFIQQYPDVSQPLTRASSEIFPVVVMDCRKQHLTEAFVRKKLDDFLLNDHDVTTKSLMTTILLNGYSSKRDIGQPILRLLGTYGCKVVFTCLKYLSRLCEGPYFANNVGVFRAFRLYADDQEAFVLTTVQSQKDNLNYESLAANVGDSHTLALAVPSRLHAQVGDTQPLAGFRIAVKDLFHLKGVHTGCGNRAYRSLYPAQRESSRAVHLALTKGCVMLGKAKTVEFGGSQEVCGDWIDYSYPFNCRGDGYLVATGSSTGSAAALAAYDFLDITIGTDAGGSVRDPATAQGLFGLRPSHDGSKEENAVVPCPRFQRSGYFGRDLAKLHKFVSHAVDIVSPHLPKLSINRIVFPQNYAEDDSEVNALVEKFVVDLARFSRAKITSKAISELWEEDKPHGVTQEFEGYFEKTFMTLLSHDYWTAGDVFRADYQEKFRRKPYVCPVTQWLWKYGQERTKDELKEAENRVRVHNTWFTRSVLDDAAHSIMIVPKFNSDHRDEYLSDPDQRDYLGFDSNLHASLAGLPNIVVPIGQIPVFSAITGVEEQIPVSVSIVSAKGTELRLIEFILAFLQHDDRPTVVQTRRTAFPVS